MSYDAGDYYAEYDRDLDLDAMARWGDENMVECSCGPCPERHHKDDDCPNAGNHADLLDLFGPYEHGDPRAHLNMKASTVDTKDYERLMRHAPEAESNEAEGRAA